MSRRTLAIAAWLLAALGCDPNGEQARRPNLLLVSVDTLRADALSAFGGPAPTPRLDRLAAEGTVFERAWAPAPTTAASHASLFTGLDVVRHGVLENGRPLPVTPPTLAEALRESGYRTAAFVSSFVLDPRFGWARGFQSFDAAFPEEGASWPKDRLAGFWSGFEMDGFDRRAEATTSAALEWLSEGPEPFFLFVHYFDPHAPYVPPRVLLRRVRRDPPDPARQVPGATPEQLATLGRRYYAEVSLVDASIDVLCSTIERRARRPTWVLVTGDHGEGLGQHGWLYHWANLHEELLHVPLLLRRIGSAPRPQRIATPVSLVDVSATLLDLAGLPPLPGSDGISLAASVREGSEPPTRALFAHRLDDLADGGVAHMLAVRDGRFKLIREGSGRERLFDLQVDPGELRDVRSREPERSALLAERLDRLEAEAPPASAPGLAPEVREGLEALGYAP